MAKYNFSKWGFDFGNDIEKLSKQFEDILARNPQIVASQRSNGGVLVEGPNCQLSIISDEDDSYEIAVLTEEGGLVDDVHRGLSSDELEKAILIATEDISASEVDDKIYSVVG